MIIGQDISTMFTIPEKREQHNLLCDGIQEVFLGPTSRRPQNTLCFSFSIRKQGDDKKFLKIKLAGSLTYQYGSNYSLICITILSHQCIVCTTDLGIITHVRSRGEPENAVANLRASFCDKCTCVRHEFNQ